MLLDDFTKDVNELVTIMLQQGFKHKMLKIKFKQFARDMWLDLLILGLIFWIQTLSTL